MCASVARRVSDSHTSVRRSDNFEYSQRMAEDILGFHAQ